MTPLVSRRSSPSLSASWPQARFTLSACKAVEGREPTCFGDRMMTNDKALLPHLRALLRCAAARPIDFARRRGAKPQTFSRAAAHLQGFMRDDGVALRRGVEGGRLPIRVIPLR